MVPCAQNVYPDTGRRGTEDFGTLGRERSPEAGKLRLAPEKNLIHTKIHGAAPQADADRPHGTTDRPNGTADRLFRLLVNAVNDFAIFLLDRQGNVTDCNDAARRAHGYRASELPGLHVSRFYPERDVRAAKPQRALELALRDGSYTEEGWRVRKDGSRFWASCSITPLRGDDGELLAFSYITRDTTERMRSEEAQHELSAGLMRMQDEERRNISRQLHDMTGPIMSSVLMNLAIVERDSAALSERSHTALQEAEALVRRCSSDIRGISYVLHPPLLTEVGLAAAVQWCLDSFSQHTGITTHLEADTDPGRLPEEMEISLYRILQECLTNIQRHSHSRTAQVHIGISGDRLTLEVRDQGKGTAGAFEERMGIKGMRERVNELGGSLEILSGDGGTTVRAVVPVERPSNAANSPARPKARLLLVDDHEIVRQGLASLLQGIEGFEVCGEVATGEEAIREADRTAPDIVIMDLRLPGMDGLQATRSILKSHPRIDVLIFTVDESEQVLREALKAGARGCLTKTDAGSSLLSMLRTLVSERDARAQAV
jgi:PAS domain S-box-containing protein